MKLIQSKLDLINKTRTSRLPWKGQFSPQFIEYLLSEFKEANYIYDPFCGSGTVLFESAILGKKAIGSEINPAAWCLSALSEKTSLSEIQEIKEQIIQLQKAQDLIGYVKDISLNKSINLLTKRILHTIILLSMGNSKEIKNKNYNKAISLVENLILDSNMYLGTSKCSLEDARYSEVDEKSIDLVITSPPYINVFNYHQNYRHAMELLGWRPLEAAKGEIGANRKFRQNRFLTVIQYAIDMGLILNQLLRVTKINGNVVLIIGRTSSVLGQQFSNSGIILDMIKESNIFIIDNIYERSFMNNYGKTITEDVLVLKRNESNNIINKDVSRSIAERYLKDIKTNNEETGVLLKLAIDKIDTINESEKVFISNPILQ